MSCQKLMSWSAVQIASLAARFAGRVGFVEAKHEPADGVGGTAAIVEQVFEGGVPRGRHVLAEGGQEVAQQRERQAMTSDGDGQLRKRRLDGRRAGGDGVERPFVTVERGQAVAGSEVAFIREVVGRTREAVDRVHGRPQRRRH
jgi:hypothetical protein